MLSRDRISRILIVRNDFTTVWEEPSSYRLEEGELGIGWLDNGNVIVKIGRLDRNNEKQHWFDCPQLEGVLEEDLVLTSDFGKYKTANGFVNAGGKDMTIKQWLQDALREPKEPIIIQPTYQVQASAIETNTGTNEIGSKIIAFGWQGEFSEGEYQYGSMSDGQVYTDTSTALVADFNIFENESIVGKGLNGQWLLTNPIEISSVGLMEYKVLKGICSWGASSREPVNNLGEKTSGKILPGTIEKNIEYFVNGYREGCFYGAISTLTDIADINNNIVRNLNKTGENYQSLKRLECLIPKDTTMFIIACPKDCIGPKNIYNTTAGAEMLCNFKKTTLLIGGADAIEDVGKYAVEYNIYYYIPATPYVLDAQLQIQLG